MADSIVRVEALGKRYRIGGKQAGYRTLRDTIMNTLTAPFRSGAHRIPKKGEPAMTSDEAFWALKNVTFDIAPGEVVGIIGRNGAGKSTLLKILSEITEPTEGRVEIGGRVASLLEVGTGFHPELTGRENVYLNGAILGMKRVEIEEKFDEIVAFSEVERFIDTPIKHYSSGMHVRLAFAVAAHLEPEILIVDEVLAVGDLAFQSKCLKRMQSLKGKGMTILLVSHNMAAIQSCCSRAVLLENGGVCADGKVLEVIQRYQHTLERHEASTSEHRASENGMRNSFGAEIVKCHMFGDSGDNRRQFEFGEAVRVRIDLRVEQRIPNPMINVGLKRADGVIVCNFNNWYDGFKVDFLEGSCTLEGWLPELRLLPGFYEVHVLLWHWGGGHIPGDMARAMPIVARRFGELHISGPAFNHHDGVFQVPAKKWLFTRNGSGVEYTGMTSQSIWRAFDEIVSEPANAAD